MVNRAGLLVLTLGVMGGVGLGQGAAGSAAAPGSGTAKRPMTFADLMAMKRVSDPQISSSGKWVLFSVTEVSLEKNTKVTNLWVVPLEASTKAGPSTTLRSAQDDTQRGVNEARQLTFGVVDQTFGRFSPDGKWVSLISAGGGSSQIWTAAWDEATGTMKKPYPLTDVSTGADGAVWSPDSKRLLFVSSVYPECSVEGGVLGDFVDPAHRDSAAMNGAPRMMVAASWVEEEACDKGKDEAAAKSAVKAQVWDSLLYRHWNAFTGKKRSHVLVVERANGEAVRDLTPASVVGDAETPTFSLGGPIGYAWAPGSEEIAYVTNLDKVPAASTNSDVFTLLLDDKGAKPRKISTSLGSDDGPAYSPDGKYIAFRSQLRAGYESDRFRLMLFDRLKGSLNEVDLPLKTYSGPPAIVIAGTKVSRPTTVTVSENDLDRWVDEFIWTSDSQRIFFTASDQGQQVIYRTNIPSGNLHRFGKFTGAELAGEWSNIILVGPGDRLAGILMKADKPAEVAIANMPEMDDTGQVGSPFGGLTESVIKTYNLRVGVPLAAPNYLTHLNDALVASVQMSPLEPFRFQGAENSTVEGFVVRPPNFDPAKKYPLKFLIHGGPQGAWGDAWSYRWNPELMAASGYVVVMVNPRGSTGYGQAFIDGVNGDWGGKAYVDLMKGLDAAEAKFPFIDKTRECALGASYGGYMANWVLTHTNRFKCIVTHDGMYNPAAAYGDTEEMWFNEWEFRRGPATGLRFGTRSRLLRGGMPGCRRRKILFGGGLRCCIFRMRRRLRW